MRNILLLTVISLLVGCQADALRSWVQQYDDEILLSSDSLIGDKIDLDGEGRIYAVDVFGTIGRYDLETGQFNALLGKLNGPGKLRIHKNRVYFVEVGTDEKKYHDGRLSCYNIDTKRLSVLLDDLNYPCSLFVTSSLDVYVLEAGAYAASFRGVNQICVLRKEEKKRKILITQLQAPDPVSLVVDSSGNILVGTNTGTILQFDGHGSYQGVFLDGLPEIMDLDIDARDNIFVAGRLYYGTPQNKGAITVVPNEPEKVAVPLKKGLSAWSVAVSDDGRIIYSACERGSKSIRALSPK